MRKNGRGRSSWSPLVRRSKDPSGAQRLRIARWSSGLTQERLAKRLGLSTSGVKNYEGGREPPRQVLILWAKITGVNEAWLKFGYGSGPSRVKPVSNRGRPRQAS